MMQLEHVYRPPALNPLQAELCNTLLTRDWPQEFDLYGLGCRVELDLWQAPFAPACGLDMAVGGAVWRVLFSSPRVMTLHPTGALLSDTSALPQGLRLALFELSLAPVLQALAVFLDLDKVPYVVAEHPSQPEQLACALPLRLCLPDEDLALCLYLPQRADVEQILLRLAAHPPVQRTLLDGAGPDVLVPVAFESGRMRLTLAELRALHLDDVLLPDVFPGFSGELHLRIAANVAVCCVVQDNMATVCDIVRTVQATDKELPWDKDRAMRNTTMTDEQQTMNEQGEMRADESSPSSTEHDTGAESVPMSDSLLDDVEVVVNFELERRLMSLADLKKLVPGYTFALPAATPGQVSVRVHGKQLGVGRLVDLDGTLGVQLISLEQER